MTSPDIKQWFEANYLDGDKVQEGQMLSSSFCLEAVIAAYARAFLAGEKKGAEGVIERIRENLPKVITPTVEPPPNKLSQNQIFAGGQVNMLLRIEEKLQALKTNQTKI